MGAAESAIRIHDFLPDRSVTRVGRTVHLSAAIANLSGGDLDAQAELCLPDGATVVGGKALQAVRLTSDREVDLVWGVAAAGAGRVDMRLVVRVAEQIVADASVPVRFLPALDVPRDDYIPEPSPAKTPLLIGAHHCPLWEADKPHMWRQIRVHPERVPALGFYSQENPEVADWETKWAVEHGISFFIYCWYRTSQGGPVEQRFGTAIHDALFKSRYADKMKFTIMWENQSRGRAGVADERDLMENLLPFWIENYFTHDSYLKVDDRPVLFVYRPEFLVQDLGSVENVASAFAKMRHACREAGFAGLYLLGEYRGTDPNHLGLMKRLGLDYTFAYCWHVQNNPTPGRAIREQMERLRRTQELAIMPQVATVTQGWSGWRDEGSIWTIPPADYEELLSQAKDFVATLPEKELGSRMLLLDNWNEWGEGHYIAPYTEHGFGYVDAVREVFSDGAGTHADLIPEDLGMGPYDVAYRKHVAMERNLRRMVSAKVVKEGISRKGLVGWWAFDEELGTPIALDYSGNGLGAKLREAQRGEGIDGRALICEGGCAVVDNHALLSAGNALTIECWVKTEAAGQNDRWFVNRIYGGGVSTGYRMGLVGGKPCFGIPQTDWSHHLLTDAAMPTDRWVHLAGTFDGETMRIYVDGALCGTMARSGPVNPNSFHLCLGSYEVEHRAHFIGSLDEVRVWSRALTSEEVARYANTTRFPGR